MEKPFSNTNMRKTPRNDQKEKTVMTAVALQDHMTRSLSLNLSLKSPKVNHSLPVRRKKNCPVLRKSDRSDQNIKQPTRFAPPAIGTERVLDPVLPPLTLAQKLGVVAKPEFPLTESQWRHVKDSSNSRQDSLQPCVICKEKFALQAQVLLSCSHVFHRVCLRSFETFSGKKSCPMCRKEQYQTRLIYDGAKIYVAQAVVRIQAHWRGYLVRRWYKQIRETIAPKDPSLRKAFFEKKLTYLTETMLHSLEQRSSDIDSLINTSNENLAYSKNVLSQLERSHVNVVDWSAVQIKAERLEISDCPICMMPLQDETSPKEKRSVSLLSCSHIYHLVCLQMYEDCYPCGRHQCPICRTYYLKRDGLDNFK